MASMFSIVRYQLLCNVNNLIENTVQFGRSHDYLSSEPTALSPWKEAVINLSDKLYQLFVYVEQHTEKNNDTYLEHEVYNNETQNYFAVLAKYQKLTIDKPSIQNLIKCYSQAYKTQLSKTSLSKSERACIITLVDNFLAYYEITFTTGDLTKLANDKILKSVTLNSKAVDYETRLKHEVEQRIREQKNIISTLSEIIEFRSGETGMHVNRVANIAAHLAKLSGLTQEEIDTIRIIAPLHDVGKIAIPDSILNKPGKLTEEEYKLMQTHSQVGFDALNSNDDTQSDLLKFGAIVAHEHHEKWDGSGYPCGKSGEKIHIFARIVAIADVFDALMSERPYKKAWEPQRVLQLFIEESGKHFDPNLIAIFVENFDDFVGSLNHINADIKPAINLLHN